MLTLRHLNNHALHSAPKIMGVLNVTPNSFSDGGCFLSLDNAIAHAARMVDAGADFIDVGGESARPGATPISVQEELDRVIPVIEALATMISTPISIDTSKPEVMRAAVNAGASMINDVCALQQPDALATASQLEVPICLMHMQGTPATMQQAPQYDDVVQTVIDFFAERIAACVAAGIVREKIILDPGFGFGKTLTHNLTLLRSLTRLHAFELPLLVGLSRKTMIGQILNQPNPKDRVLGSVAAALIAAGQGADIIRVHDVAETFQALTVFNKVFHGETN